MHGFPGYDITAKMPSVVDVLDGRGNTGAVRVNVVPGSIWRYSGGGYTVAQLSPTSQENRSRNTWRLRSRSDRHDAQHVRQPLPAARAAETASGYLANTSPVSAKEWHVYPEMAAAGLWTTATDLALFALEIQQSHARQI